MEESLALGLWNPECPSSALQVLWVLPSRLYSFPENMHRVPELDFIPGIIIVDSIEGGNIRDVFVKNIESTVVIV